MMVSIWIVIPAVLVIAIFIYHKGWNVGFDRARNEYDKVLIQQKELLEFYEKRHQAITTYLMEVEEHEWEEKDDGKV